MGCGVPYNIMLCYAVRAGAIFCGDKASVRNVNLQLRIVVRTTEKARLPEDGTVPPATGTPSLALLVQAGGSQGPQRTVRSFRFASRLLQPCTSP